MGIREPNRDASGRGGSGLERVGRILTVLLTGIAYFPLLWPGSGPSGLGDMLFEAGTAPPQLPVGIAGILLALRWRRLARPGSSRLLSAALAVSGVALFVWAQLADAAWLLLPALALHGLALAAALAGGSGCRAAAVPALVLLLGMPLPRPLADEVLWQLQQASAAAAGWLLAAAGRDFVQLGVVLRDHKHFFHVIDGCSGLNGIVILTLIAFLVRELFADAGRRGWLVVGAAPLLGFAVNAVRVAYIASIDDPAALAGDHTGQGLAVLMGGTVLLYGLGLALAPRKAPPAPADPRRTQPPRTGVWLCATALAALLGILSATVEPFPEALRPLRAANLQFPERKAGWIAEPAPANRTFHGPLSGGFHRRYRLETGPNRPDQVVDVLVGYESSLRSFRMLSSKLSSPGPGWSVESRDSGRLWTLEREMVQARAARGRERAISYAWRQRDRGLWRESWRALLALDSTPLRREAPRAGIRLFAYSPHGHPMQLDRARQRLDRFVADFHEELEAI